MRPKLAQARPLDDGEAQRAWGIMSRGGSIVKAAQQLGVSPQRLDRAVWAWRAKLTRRHCPQELVMKPRTMSWML